MAGLPKKVRRVAHEQPLNAVTYKGDLLNQYLKTFVLDFDWDLEGRVNAHLNSHYSLNSHV